MIPLVFSFFVHVTFNNIAYTNLIHGVESVSYTHLDVYKRQAYTKQSSYFDFHVQDLLCGLQLHGSGKDSVT